LLHAMTEMRVHPAAEVAVVLVDEAAMEQLHIQWMGEPGPTDVLSFPMDELRPGRDGDLSEEGILGDIVLCPTVAKNQAEAAGHSVMQELQMLTVHGLLHLLGYDHAEPEEEAEMFGLQGSILKAFHQSEV
jgi:rRNA maturation RNase YbeY